MEVQKQRKDNQTELTQNLRTPGKPGELIR